MAIALGTKTLTFEEHSRTWRFQIEAPHNGPARAEIFREVVRVPTEAGDEPTNYPSYTPIIVPAEDLDELADYCEIPLELQAVIPNSTALRKYLQLTPALISIACDAAERRQNELRDRSNLTIQPDAEPTHNYA